MSDSGDGSLELVKLREEVVRLRAELAKVELEPLRAIWKKLIEIEKKVDGKVEAAQAALKLAGKSTKKVNPDHTLLMGRMLAAWSKAKGQRYSFEGGKDAGAIKNLLKRGMTIDALVGRWEYAFKNGCVSVFEFNMNFNKYVPVSTSTRPQVAAGTDVYAETK